MACPIMLDDDFLGGLQHPLLKKKQPEIYNSVSSTQATRSLSLSVHVSGPLDGHEWESDRRALAGLC